MNVLRGYKNIEPTVAVLGAGIMGCSVAILLARQKIKVKLFDAEPNPFMGASRWNEGKIHLGYLYTGDESLSTARKIIPGGLAFLPLIKELLGLGTLEGMVTEHNDTYLIHKNSIISELQAYDRAKKIHQLCLK
jgi:glycine/D-amino acid oxidase-like deaminating enzyme